MKLNFPFKTLESFVKDYVKDYKITPDGEIAINSPIMSDTTYDCRINVEKQCWHDWESDEGGGIESLVAIIAGVEKEDAKDILLHYGPTTILEDNEPQIKEVDTTLNLLDFPQNSFSFTKEHAKKDIINFKKAISFLETKLVNFTLTKKYDLRWTTFSTLTVGKKKQDISNRIIIPTYENENLAYYQTRDYTGNRMRYKNPPKELQLKSIIVPFYDLIEENQPLFLSEGPWEAIQYSGTYMLGPSISYQQIEKIKKKNPKEIYIIADNDPTGRKKLISNINSLRMFLSCPIFIIHWWKELTTNKDPIEAKLTFNDLLKCDIIPADRSLELKIRLGILDEE